MHLRVAEAFVSFLKQLEIVRGVGVAGVFIRVFFYGTASIGALDFVRGSREVDPQNGIITFPRPGHLSNLTNNLRLNP